MGLSLFDNPLILNSLFFPRPATMQPDSDRWEDGFILVEDDVRLGYRFYRQESSAPVVVYFHGNGEIVTDYQTIAPMFHGIGASLLVIDFRGYGWSTGTPKVSTLLSDTEAVHNALHQILPDDHGNLYVMGRSLGSPCAIHIAHKHPETFKGIIIESGFAYVAHLMMRRGFPVESIAGNLDPVGNVRKMKELNLPLLVIHGENDELIPVSHGQNLYDASPHPQKEILRIPHAGHNTLLMVATHAYFAAIAKLIAQTTS